ncbi:hypothetical protein [Vibrio sp. F13]|uniref:hypothetical protein n=1 Tax=Vibrio sp. F13 TaxID=2070777 RepID=UPI001F1104BB|nr:hypothetical protein [Vibrio sp. F13]
MQMYTLRVSLAPQDPELFKRENKCKDVRSFERALLHAATHPQNANLAPSDAKYSLKVLVKPDNKGVMGGMVSKAKKLHGHDAEFNEYDVDDFPPLVWFWDLSEQVILVERKTSVFSSAMVAAKAFQKITNNIELAEVGLRAEIEPILDDGVNEFWSEYDNFEFVERIELELIPPNLFGDTEKSMKKALNNVSEQTNANKMKTVLENTDGKLKLSSDGWVGNAVRWIKKGGGSWKMWGKRSAKSSSTNVSSNKSAKITVIEGELTEAQFIGYDSHDLAHLLSHLRPKYTYKDNNDED